MPIDDQLLDILCCPETRQPVARAEAAVLAPLNAEIEAGRLRNRGGAKVETVIEEGLLREDGRVLYIVDDSIPIMLIGESIELG
ncbi:MAG: hypothetical protein NXI30_07860 [bacterium]|nr:hypothetical protein [bacterium]